MLGRERDEALEQPGADPAPLVVVADGERDLGGAPVAQARVVRERDDAALEAADERAGLLPVRVDERLDELRAERGKAVEAEVAALVGELLEERQQHRRCRPRRAAAGEASSRRGG